MVNHDDETYLLFLEESQEHLADIEADLLELESQQENPDEELLNKVFRAIHTVKGGSGFFGLTKIKDLSHIMENLLGLVRAGTMSISSEMISLILDGADLLRRMVFTPDLMDELDIKPQVEALEKFVNGTYAETVETESPITEEFEEIGLPGEPPLFVVPKLDILNAQMADGGGNYIYLVKYDLYADIEDRGKTPQIVVKDFIQLTYFIDSFIDYSQMGSLENMGSRAELPFYILCATVMDPTIMAAMAGLPENQLVTIHEKRLKSSSETVSESEQGIAGNPVEVEAAPIFRDNELAETPASIQQPQPVMSDPAQSKTIVSKQKSPSTVRIAVNQLEVLMNLAGELVLTRNELLQRVGAVEDRGILDAAQRVDAITSELQGAIMVTRMQSVGIVFTKFKRVVRDLSSSLGKKVDLVVEGEDVELDRTIVEAIGDPLTHMVRNSIDHGIEMPEVRLAAGKVDTGTLHLKAMHRAGQVIISISDDGAGIDPEVIGNIAIGKGIITQQELDTLSKKDIIKLIFRPGFSTAEEVTDISGRGVGMDVVLSTFNKVGGEVDIDSTVGSGSVITIKLPLTLAIIPSLLMKVEEERFAIPQLNLVELVRVKGDKINERIGRVSDASVLRLRGELLPLVKLSDLLGIEDTFINPETGERMISQRKDIADRRSPDLNSIDVPPVQGANTRGGRRKAYRSSLNIAVVTSGDCSFGIIADSFLDSEEIVVKPLGIHLKECPFYAGATILGDGQVAMILDITSIRDNSIVKGVSEKINRMAEAKAERFEPESQPILLFKNGQKNLFALPMVQVVRIEKIAASSLKDVGDRQAIFYRGDTLIIVSLGEVNPIGNIPDQESYNVVVFEINGKELGLLVGSVLDIVSFSGTIDGKSYVQPGIMGSFVLGDEIAMLVDLREVSQTIIPDLIEEQSGGSGTILVVEDSSFFRKQISSLLEEQGYEIITAEDGQDGLQSLIDNKQDLDMIITDIDMPVMDGFEMSKQIRAVSGCDHIPIIALTALSGAEAEKKGEDAGITEYLIKMDKEQMIDICRKYMART